MLKQTRHTLQDDFECSGLWWLPNEPDKRLSGVLRYAGEQGTRLTITGSFGDWPGDSQSGPFRLDVITGLTSDGVRCTIVDNLRTNLSFSAPGMIVEEFRPQYLIMGEHFQTKDDLVFGAFDANFQYLEEWLGRAFQSDFQLEEGGTATYHFSVTSRTLVDGFVSSADGEVTLSVYWRTIKETISELHVVTEIFLTFRPMNPQPLAFFERLFFDIKRFFTLVVGENTYTRRLRAYPTRKDEEGPRLPLGIYYRQPVAVTSNPFYQHNALLPFESVVDQLPSLLDRWLGNAEQLRPVYDLFFSTVHEPDMYVGNRFLNLIYAVESYHRLVFGGQYLEPEKYEEVYNSLVNAIPKDSDKSLKAALKSRLQFGNEYSLPKRFRLLFRDLDNELVQLITSDPEGFSRCLVDTRNYLVHRDPASKALAYDNEGMFYANQRLRILLTILLLQSLGINDKEIREAIAENRRFHPWDE